LIYADSSFLVSLYLRDAHSGLARAVITEVDQDVVLSRIASLEVKNAFRLAEYRGWITADQRVQVERLFELDAVSGFLRSVPFVADEIFAVCESLSSLYTTRTGNRTLDILHLASASHLDLKNFASFDRRQRGLAKRLGLRLLPESLEA
jgi:predicted nucleic acid-binding protein